MSYCDIQRSYIYFTEERIKAELVVPHVDFHKLPHKISAEGKRSPKIASQNNMAVVTSSSKPSSVLSRFGEYPQSHPLMLSPGFFAAQMYAFNNMLPSPLSPATNGQYHLVQLNLKV